MITTKFKRFIPQKCYRLAAKCFSAVLVEVVYIDTKLKAIFSSKSQFIKQNKKNQIKRKKISSNPVQ